MSLLFAVLLFATSTIACTAINEQQQSEQLLTQNDSIVQTAVGDSIFAIIVNAKSITAEIVGYTDSTKEKTPEVKLSADDIKILKFLLMNPQNVSSNDTVFGKVLPNICFTFKSKNKICQLLFDFGLKKWQILDADFNILKTFDLKSSEFVHLASRLFPNDEYLNLLLNQ